MTPRAHTVLPCNGTLVRVVAVTAFGLGLMIGAFLQSRPAAADIGPLPPTTAQSPGPEKRGTETVMVKSRPGDARRAVGAAGI